MSLYEDLLDSNYIFSSEKIDVFSWRVYQKKHYYYLAFGLLRYFGHVIGSIKTIRNLPTLWKVKKGDIVVILTSLNQYDSIQELLKDESLNIKPIAIDYAGAGGVLKFPMFISYFLSIFLIPLTFYYYFITKSAYVKKSFRYGFREYCLTFAYRFVNTAWLKWRKPRLLIVLTDHQMVGRDMVKSARKAGVKSLYMQHASVTDKFPALIMDYAFLEGEDAKDKYLEIGGGHTDTIIDFVGILKLNKISTEEHQIEMIGICTNEFDDIAIADGLLSSLEKDFKITLRPHPGDSLYEEWRALAEKHHITFSDSRREKPADFLSSVNCVVSYNCGITTESLMLNKPTFSFQMSQKEFDHYGFLEHHIVDHYNKPAELAGEIRKIRNTPNAINWKKKAKYYCDTIDTPYEGRSADLVKKLLVKYNI